MAKKPDWLEKARSGWEYIGQKRPDFAIEPEEGQESVWDYPRPPAIETDGRLVQVKWSGQIIAESTNAIQIKETASPPTFYIPPADVDMSLLSDSGGTSLCEWKGQAVYWDLNINGMKISDVGWSYPDPYDEFEQCRDHISFYPSKIGCYVDGVKVKSQSGGFYGGWITDNIVGPFKGDGPETML